MSNTDEEIKYRGPTIPTPIGENFQITLGLANCAETFGDWVEAIEYVTKREDIDVDLDVLSTTEASPHRATFNDKTQHYQYTQDHNSNRAVKPSFAVEILL